MKTLLRLFVILSVAETTWAAGETPAEPANLASAPADAHDPASAHESPGPDHATPGAPHEPAHVIATAPDDPSKLTGAPIESLMRLGESQSAAGDFENAIIAYFQVLENHAPPTMEVQALLGLAGCYQHVGERTRAVAVLERLIKDYSGHPETAGALLTAGRIHRSLGAERLAMSRFYAVLQSTLKVPDGEWAQKYRQLARTAQYEIAETHLRSGRYDDAERFFARFSLLELAPADRARGAFKVIEARSAAGKLEGVVQAVNQFVDHYPTDQHVPAALHHATTALRELGRNDEAMNRTLELLQKAQTNETSNPEIWAYWQRRTGNELANTFFQRGEFTNARQIYDTLATLDEDPEWQVPALYQGALCRERLGLSDQAIQLYRDIVTTTEESASTALREIADMARWRISHLDHLDRERAAVRDLVSSLPQQLSNSL